MKNSVWRALSILMFLTVQQLMAESFYVEVMHAKSKTQLYAVSYNMGTLGYKRSIDRTHYGYVLYAGPFSSQANANVAEYNINRLMGTQSTRVVSKTTTRVSHQKSVDTQHNAPRKEGEYDKYFFGASMGINYISSTQNDLVGAIELDSQIDSDGLSAGAELGYYYNKNIFLTLNYEHISLSDIYLNNSYLSINYEFFVDESVSPYLGILGGFSVLTWKESPISSIQSDLVSSSLMSGVLAGSNIKLSEQFHLFVAYQLWIMNQETNLENSQGKMQIQHKLVHSLNVGFRYKF